MNVIVSNKQKDLIDNANIDAIKDLYGLFNVEDLINNFKYYFFSKMIIDATSIIDFSNPKTLTKLANGIGADKLIILLPRSPEPPKLFLKTLIDLGIYNFTTKVNEIVLLLQKPNSYDDVKRYLDEEYNYNIYQNNVDKDVKSDNMFVNTAITGENSLNVSQSNLKNIIGFKNVTSHAGSTTLIYMLKKQLEKKYNKSVVAFEINANDFVYFREDNMVTLMPENVNETINNCSNDIILIDLGDSNYESICSKVIYLVEPSVIKVNKLMVNDRNSFSYLHNKCVVLNKSMLTSSDVEIFAKEAGLPIFFNIPPLNDRLTSNVIDELLNKMGVIVGNQQKMGIFNTFE